MQAVQVSSWTYEKINPLNAKLNPICHLLALLGPHHILDVRRIRVKAPLSLIRNIIRYNSPDYTVLYTHPRRLESQVVTTKKKTTKLIPL